MHFSLILTPKSSAEKSFPASVPAGCPGSGRVGIHALVALSVLLLGCKQDSNQQASTSPPKVICSLAMSREITDFDGFVGRTESSETVEVRARVSGFLRTVDFQDGAFVEKDELLATIEPDEYSAIHDQSLARIQLAQTQLALSKSEFNRSQLLIKSSAISQEEYEEKAATVSQSEAGVLVAKADAARTGLDLKYTEIRAPIAGRVDRAFVTPGNLVTGGLGSGTLLTRIVNDTPIYAYIDVDEGSILRYVRKKNNSKSADAANEVIPFRDLKIPCELQLNDEQDYPHVGVLDFVETRVDKQTGTIRIRGVFENTDRLLRGGMFVRVRIPTSEPYAAVMIPEMAIGTDQSYKFAYVVNADSQAELRTLTLGASQGSQRIITDGIQAGETVIIRGVQRVRPGMKVNPSIEELPNAKAAVGEPPVAVFTSPETAAEGAAE